jgi:copper(I)-binding protein
MSPILSLLVATVVTGAIASGPVSGSPAVPIVAHHGKVYQTNKAGVDTQGFVEIDNAGSSADTLTNAKCPLANTTSIVGADGNAINSLVIAPGQNLTLTANGPHLLLQSTHFTVDHGGAVPCSLTFQNAGEISVYLYSIPAP